MLHHFIESVKKFFLLFFTPEIGMKPVLDDLFDPFSQPCTPPLFKLAVLLQKCFMPFDL